jgi:synaptojanin
MDQSASDKSSRLLIRDYPHRAIAIATSTHALILKYSPTTNEAIHDGTLASVPSARSRPGGDAPISKCMVEFAPISDQLLHEFRPLTPRSVFGTLGLISINEDVFLCVVTHAKRVATLRPGETVERIITVDFFCLNSSEYDYISPSTAWDGGLPDSGAAYGQALGRREVELEYPYQELQKLLSNGTFYYSTDFDLTNRLQDRYVALMSLCSATLGFRS